MSPISTRKPLTKTAKPAIKAAKSPAAKPAKKSTPTAKAAAVTPKKAASAKAPVAKKTAAKAKASPAVKAKTPAKKAVAVKAPAAKAPAAKKAPVAKKAVKAAPVAPSTALAKRISAILDTNKAEEITTLHLADQCSFADYMIVASGRAPRHVSALADYVTDLLKKEGNPPLSVEGKETGDWVLIDAGDVIVHIFRPEVRMFYNIEKMWTLPPAASRL